MQGSHLALMMGKGNVFFFYACVSGGGGDEVIASKTSAE